MAPSATTEEHFQKPIPYTKPSPTIYASVLHGPRDLRLETRILEAPSIGELQIAIKSTGICGSDVSYYKKFANGDLCACAPLSLGHESSGVVMAIGPNVSNFNIGDRVALEVGIPCGKCIICRKGRYNLCKRMRFRSSAKSVPHFQGTLQERINHPANWCYKLPDHISFDAAALLEPLSVAVHAVNRAIPDSGSTALVIGAGTIGLLTAAMALHSGCKEVTIIDLDAGRVNYAISKGFATHGYVVPTPLQPSFSSSSICNSSSKYATLGVTFSSNSSSSNNSTRTSSEFGSGFRTPASQTPEESMSSNFDSAKILAADIVATIIPLDPEDEEVENPGFDTTYECTGSPSSTHLGLYATKPGGKLLLIGMGNPVQTLPVSVAQQREVDLLGVFRYSGTYGRGIELLGSGENGEKGRMLQNLEDMITHRVKGLKGVGDAMELASGKRDGYGRLVIKVVVEVGS